MIALVLSARLAVADDTTDVGDVDLTNLLAPTATGALDAPTDVASASDLTGRESPGVITVLTREQILATGARDLLDVLRLVPGLDFGVDVNGVVSLGVRGLWAHEGKWLLLVDDHVMNETTYSVAPLGHRLPVELIERVEVLRGPGSTMYGGFAELGVIRVTTVAGGERVGGTAAARVDHTGETLLRGNASGAGAFAWDGGRFATYATAGSGVRSDGVFDDGWGTTVDMAEASRLTPIQAGFDLRQGDLAVNGVFDRYGLQMQDGYGEALAAPVNTSFTTASLAARYGLQASERTRVTPYARVVLHQPWFANDAESGSVFDYRRKAARATLGTEARSTLAEGVDLRVGGEGYVDTAWGLAYGEATERDLEGNGALFAEAVARTTFATVAVGARAELHSEGGPSFVPRLAVTRTFEDAHVKLLAARAFRPPGIENSNWGEGVRSEVADVFEVEAGTALGERQYATVNVYDQTLRYPIVYFYEELEDGSYVDGYKNYDRSGTRGVELHYHLRTGRVSASASWSFYSAANRTQVDTWAVPGRDDLMLGFPAQKGVMTVSANPWRALRFGGTVVGASERLAYVPAGDASGLVLDELPPYALIDLLVGYDRLGNRPVGVTLLVHDVAGNSPAIPQPYDGGHAPLPGASRSVELRLVWDGLHDR